MNKKNHPPDYFLDITQDLCPMTFVKARLQVEKMNIGEFLEIRLQGTEPLKNVPESLTELGHRIHSLDPADLMTDAGDETVFQLIVEKS